MQASARFAGAAPAAIVRTRSRQAEMSRRPRFIWLQRHMSSKRYAAPVLPSHCETRWGAGIFLRHSNQMRLDLDPLRVFAALESR